MSQSPSSFWLPHRPLIDCPSLLKLADLITARYEFTSFANFKHILRGAQTSYLTGPTAQYLIFTNIPENDIPQLLDTRSSATRLTINTNAKFVIVKMLRPNLPMDSLSRCFDSRLSFDLFMMGIDEPHNPMLHTTITFGNWTRKADSSWSYTPEGHMNYIIETGFSEPEDHLTLEALGWFELSSHVRIVLTLDIDRTRPKIIIKEWHKSSQDKIFIRQQTIIERENEISQASGPITFPLVDLIGRPPDGPDEIDITIDTARLVGVAESVWRRQGFLPMVRVRRGCTRVSSGSL